MGTLWIDEREFPKVEGMVAELKPGEHTIRAIFGKTEMQQLMTVKAGEAFELMFDRKGRKVNLVRVPPKK